MTKKLVSILALGFMCIVVVICPACVVRQTVKVTEQTLIKVITDQSRACGGKVVSIQTLPSQAGRFESWHISRKPQLETTFPNRSVVLTMIRGSDKVVFKINVKRDYVTDVHVQGIATNFGAEMVAECRGRLSNLPLVPE